MNFDRRKAWIFKLDEFKISSVLEAQEKLNDINFHDLSLYMCLTYGLIGDGSRFPNISSYEIFIGIGESDTDWFDLGFYSFDEVGSLSDVGIGKYTFEDLCRKIIEYFKENDIKHLDYVCAGMINSYVSFRLGKPAPFTAAEIKRKHDAVMSET